MTDSLNIADTTLTSLRDTTETPVAVSKSDSDTIVDKTDIFYPFSIDTTRFADRHVAQTFAVGNGERGVMKPFYPADSQLIGNTIIACLVITCVGTIFGWSVLYRRLNNFFKKPKNIVEMVESIFDNRFASLLMVNSCLSFALAFLVYAESVTPIAVVKGYERQVIFAAILVCVVGYIALKYFLYHITDKIFFSPERYGLWMKYFTLMLYIEGVALLLATIAYVYFVYSLTNVLYLYTFVVILVKIFTIYKCFSIFFQKTSDISGILLYLCTLEIIPLLTLVKAVGIMYDMLLIKL